MLGEVKIRQLGAGSLDALYTALKKCSRRRGEVSALRENRFDFGRQQVRVTANYIIKQGNRIEKAPKDGEGRVLSHHTDPAARQRRSLGFGGGQAGAGPSW